MLEMPAIPKFNLTLIESFMPCGCVCDATCVIFKAKEMLFELSIRLRCVMATFEFEFVLTLKMPKVVGTMKIIPNNRKTKLQEVAALKNHDSNFYEPQQQRQRQQQQQQQQKVTSTATPGTTIILLVMAQLLT
uniref:Uncharacterized protein n=1 Tax=Glossina pallidipes TaxID=7398 RepID=A0A1A9ZGF7_GLOPL